MAAPALVYVPEGWTNDSQAEWKAMGPGEQADRCWAMLGWISPPATVLPLSAMVYDLRFKPVRPLQEWRFPAMTESSVLLFVPGDGRLYAGTRDKVFQHCRQEVLTDGDDQLCLVNYISMALQDSLPDCRRRDLGAVVDFLDQTCRQQENLVVSYRQVLSRVQNAHRTLIPVRARIDEAITSEKTLAKANKEAIAKALERNRREAMQRGQALLAKKQGRP